MEKKLIEKLTELVNERMDLMELDFDPANIESEKWLRSLIFDNGIKLKHKTQGTVKLTANEVQDLLLFWVLIWVMQIHNEGDSLKFANEIENWWKKETYDLGF